MTFKELLPGLAAAVYPPGKGGKGKGRLSLMLSAALVACGVGDVAGAAATVPPASAPAPAAAAPSKEALRDVALARMRATDLTPIWGHSRDWQSIRWKNVGDYLTGQITPQVYAQRKVDGYHLDDPYGLNLLPLVPANYTRTGGNCYFTTSRIHMLSGRYSRTKDVRYLNQWMAINRDMALNQQAQLSALPAAERAAWRSCAGIDVGDPLALLMNGIHVMGAMQALGVMAKTVDQPTSTTASWSDWESLSRLPTTRLLLPSQRDAFPADALYDIAGGIARSWAPHLTRHYATNLRMPNQRFTGLSALALTNHFFEDHPDVKAISGRVDDGMAAFFKDTVNKDGGFIEQSFNYNLAQEKEIRVVARLPQRSWSSAANEALSKWDLLEAGLATPQGGLPQVGNSLWQAGSAQPSTRFAQTSLAFPYSGYYAMRSSWEPDASYLFFFNRRAGRGHTMAGGNSVQVGAMGRRLIVAGGIPNYAGGDLNHPAADAYRSETSTWKTNTIVVDDKSQLASTDGLNLRADGKPDPNVAPDKPINARWHSSANFDFVEGLHTGGYAGLAKQDVTHWRGVTFLRELQTWVIVDIMRSPSFRRYKQIWKFAAPVVGSNGVQSEGFTANQVLSSAASRIIATQDATPGAVNLTLRQFGLPVSYDHYFGSDKGPYGYVGTGFGPGPGFSPDVHASFSGAGDQVLITVLRPSAGLAGDGFTLATDVTANGITGADLRIGWNRLQIRASASAANLTAMGEVANQANLLIVQSVNGAKKRLVIGDIAVPAASYEATGGVRQPVKVPSAFKWTTDSQGRFVVNLE